MRKDRSFWLAFTLVSLISASVYSQDRESGRRRSFDAASFLKRMDANSNGALEPNELSDRTKRFVEGLGFDPNETHPLDKIIAKIEGDKQESEKSAQAANSAASERKVARKVPGFGVEKPTRSTPPDFSQGPQASDASLEGKYGETILEQAENAIRRYDQNSDGVIDQEEMKEGRWGQPDPQQSDLNGDGKLTKAEMAERYYRRERSSEDRDRDRDSNRERNQDRDRDNQNRESSERNSNEGERQRDSNENRERSSEPSRDNSSPQETGESPGVTSDRYRRYADGLIQQYDNDKDGLLSKEEIAQMKQRPENADLDNDGKVSAPELTEALANGNVGASTRNSSGASSNPSGSTERNSFRNRTERGPANDSAENRSSSSERSRTSGGSSSSSFSFNASDKNGDGQVQMHEFADDWNDEKLNEFRQLDRNGDGVITEAENRNRR